MIKDVTNVIFAKKDILIQDTLKIIKEFTLEKNHRTSVSYVKRVLLNRVVL